MGKRKNNRNPQAQQAAPEQSQPNNGEESAEAQSPIKDRTKEENKNNAQGNIVLKVYMHCQGCADKVVKSLRGFPGVEVIETNLENHKVTVKGNKADPIKVAERLRKKTGKHAQLISPIPPKQKKEEKDEKEKKTEAKVIEISLKIYLHCEGCAKDVKTCIHKMHGVQTVEANLEKGQVIVKGAFDAKELVDYIKKKAGKHAEIIKPGKNDKGGNHEEREKEGKKNDKDSMHQQYPELGFAPQFFSDENPNACHVM